MASGPLFAGIAPNTGASGAAMSGAKVAPSKGANQQDSSQHEGQTEDAKH